MTRVFITRELPPIAAEILGAHFEVDQSATSGPLPREKLASVCREYDGIVSTVADTLSAEVLGEGGPLVAISNYAMGVDNVDLAAAAKRNIRVYHLPDVVSNSTADHTFALLLALIRRVPAADAYVRESRWGAWDPAIFVGEELAGKTIGIIGYGRVGRAVARRAIGFDLSVVFVNRSRVEIDEPLRKRVMQVTMDELGASADYVTVHVPLTSETRGLVNLERMKTFTKRPILVNMARGDVVDTDALVTALRSGLLRGAALDVTAPEPIAGDHPLCSLPNCLITPHIGTSTLECRREMARVAALNLLRHFREGT